MFPPNFMACGTCRFYEPRRLQCRRRPPIVLYESTPNGSWYNTVWPSVTSEEWCGDHEFLVEKKEV